MIALEIREKIARAIDCHVPGHNTQQITREVLTLASAAVAARENALQARIDTAMEVAIKMREQLVSGPELKDILGIIAALAPGVP